MTNEVIFALLLYWLFMWITMWASLKWLEPEKGYTPRERGPDDPEPVPPQGGTTRPPWPPDDEPERLANLISEVDQRSRKRKG